MKKPYSLLVAISIALAFLTSCSRANYAVNATAPAYLSSKSMAAVVVAQPATVPATIVVASDALATSPQSGQIVKVAVTAPVAKQARPSLVQRVLIKKVSKQLARMQASRQNTANVVHATASKTGRAAEIALAGLALILLGVAINGVPGAILAVVGEIALLVGLILVVIHLVNGD